MARTNIKLAAENKTGSALILYTRDSPDSPAFDFKTLSQSVLPALCGY